MERFFQWLRDYPALAGIAVFVCISLLLAVVLGGLMLKSGSSLKPLVFFFGFVAIIGVPQAVVHALDALAHHRAAGREAEGFAGPGAREGGSRGADSLKPVPWEAVFGPGADPSLRTDPRKSLAMIFDDASAAGLSFSASGETALAARFPGAAEARAALQRYMAMFQFAQTSGSDQDGWTGRRHAGQGEWNHVVAAGNELYAWTGPTRESVEGARSRALGPMPEASASVATGAAEGASRRAVSNRLRNNKPVMAAFVGINLVLAVAWFFKGSAWAARVAPSPGAMPINESSLRERLLALGGGELPLTIRSAADSSDLEIEWRYADARWLDFAGVHKRARAHKLRLSFNAPRREVRVREFWSAVDASAGPDGLNFSWRALSGIQFFQVDYTRVVGAQLDEKGRPTGALSGGYSFNLQEMKRPAIQAVTESGWTWQPVVWNLRPGSR
jgi:hypothetical protein